MSTVLVGVKVESPVQPAFDTFTKNVSAWWQSSDCFEFSCKGPGTLEFEGLLGGRFIERYDDGSEFEIGEILDWTAGKSLMFNWRQERFANDAQTQVQVTFQPIGSDTRVTVIHKGWGAISTSQAAKTAAVAPTFLPRFSRWWQHSLKQYETLLHHT